MNRQDTIHQSDTQTVTPDGEMTLQIGLTAVQVQVFFDHESNITAKDRIVRLMLSDAEKEAV